MQAFVLTAGRTGSVTVSKAFSHATNLTSGHETNRSFFGDARFAYPVDHVETDMWLAWFLGELGQRYPDALYIHLMRDPEATARSWLRRLTVHPPTPAHPANMGQRALRRLRSKYPMTSMIHAFAYGVLFRKEPWPEPDRMAVARFYVDTVNNNIDGFLSSRPHRVLHLEAAAETFPSIWDWIGADGDLAAAREEFSVMHNASADGTDGR